MDEFGPVVAKVEPCMARAYLVDLPGRLEPVALLL